MRFWVILFAHLLILLAAYPVNSQTNKFNIGLEVFYNHNFYSDDYRYYDEVLRNKVGGGIIIESPLSQAKTKWVLNYGLLYYFLYSFHSHKYPIEIQCSQFVLDRSGSYEEPSEALKSHNLRVPLKIGMRAKRMEVDAGMLFNYELSNSYTFERIVFPAEICPGDEATDPVYWSGEKDHHPFSFGPEVDFGYAFMVGKTKVVPGIRYNLIMEFENSAATQARYMYLKHGIGVGCKLFWN